MFDRKAYWAAYYVKNFARLMIQKGAYYRKNCATISAAKRKKYHCECGSVICYDHLARHYETYKHKAYLPGGDNRRRRR